MPSGTSCDTAVRSFNATGHVKAALSRIAGAAEIKPCGDATAVSPTRRTAQGWNATVRPPSRSGRASGRGIPGRLIQTYCRRFWPDSIQSCPALGLAQEGIGVCYKRGEETASAARISYYRRPAAARPGASPCRQTNGPGTPPGFVPVRISSSPDAEWASNCQDGKDVEASIPPDETSSVIQNTRVLSAHVVQSAS